MAVSDRAFGQQASGLVDFHALQFPFSQEDRGSQRVLVALDNDHAARVIRADDDLAAGIGVWSARNDLDAVGNQGSADGPVLFRNLGIGKLVGKRTWGGLVGVLGFPVLMDGGFVTAPDLAIWNDDGWVVENVGVPPDIEVEQLPAEVIAGRDPQLEKAIEVVLSELEKSSQPGSARPDYPVRVRREQN